MFQPTVTKRVLATWAVAATFAAPACSAAPADKATARPASGEVGSPAAKQIVVLGDSLATTNACPGCTGFPELYEQSLARRTGSDVEVANHAVPNTGTADLLRQLRHDDGTRQVLSDADAVVVMIGFNDTPWNHGDDPCQVAPDYPVILWNQITDECIRRVTQDHAEQLHAVLTTLDSITPADSALRVLGVYNSVIGDHVDPGWDSPEAVAPSIAGNAAFVAAQREAAERHDGVFVDMLKRMNGPHGKRPAGKYLAADYTHLNQRGHELTARALVQSGWED